MSLTPEKWRIVNEIFTAAVDLTDSRQLLFLDEACADDSDIRSVLDRMLVAAKRENAAIDRSILTDPDLALAPVPGATLGSYRLMQVLGSGGMGIVYRARQESPRREVALKLLPPANTTEAMLNRFSLESETLGLLKHPGIAQIFEAGVVQTSLGDQPFFAMELVEGSTITRYCQEKGLSLHDRVALLARACDAVHHAHTQGVIHRDLKPDNILVDRNGHPKIIDFGIARIVDPLKHEASSVTRTGEILGTLQYMSPEQREAKRGLVDTRTDVYALGAVGYEMMAERPPIDLRDSTILEALSKLKHAVPSPLGTSVPACKGELQAIIGCAMHEDPNRRYQSTSELTEDLGRYLRGESIVATLPSRWWLVRTTVRRHRGALAAIVAIVVALSAGLGLALWQWSEARQENALARNIIELLSGADSRDGSGIDPDRLGELSAHLLRDPLDEHRKMVTIDEEIGRQFQITGRYDLARPHFERALRATERLRGPTHKRVLRRTDILANLLLDAGDPVEAHALAENRLKSLGFPSARQVVTDLSWLESEKTDSEKTRIIKLVLRCADAECDLGNADDAIALYEGSLTILEPIQEGWTPSQQWDVIDARRGLGVVLYESSRDPERAIVLLEKVIAARGATDQASLLIHDLGRLAGALRSADRLLEAATLVQTHDLREWTRGKSDIRSLWLQGELANLKLTHDRNDALEMLRTAYETAQEKHEDHWRTQSLRIQLADLLRDNHPDQADNHESEALARLRDMGFHRLSYRMPAERL